MSMSKPLTRRNFVKTGALSGASLLASSGLTSPLLGAPKSKNLGIALVGLGQYAMGELAPALQQTKHCHLAGLVSGTPAKLDHFGKQYKVSQRHIYNYENYDSMADDKAIDIVYVVLPNSMHAHYSIRAADAGKHVICEKPMGLTVAECDEMIAASKANGVTLNVGYRLHFDPYHQVIKHLGENRPLGSVNYLRADCCQVIGDPKQWRLRKAYGGGAIFDIGIYCIQAARYATNAEPIAITAQEFKTDSVKFAEVDETVTFQLEFPNQVVASCTCSFNSHGHKLYISYSKNNDFLELSNAFYYRSITGSINSRPMDNIKPINQQAAQMDGIAKSITAGTDSGITGAEGRQDIAIIEALHHSLENDGARTEI